MKVLPLLLLAFAVLGAFAQQARHEDTEVYEPVPKVITSGAVLVEGDGPAEAFRLPDVPGVAVVPRLAEGRKCARSWKISPAVGLDPQFPDVTPRDAQALREWEAMRRAAE